MLAFSVSARTNEIGIRMSLGADGGKVQRMVLSEGGLLVALGLVARRDRRAVAVAADAGAALRRGAARSRHARGGRGADGGGRHRRVLDPGAARGAHRSGGGAAGAVVNHVVILMRAQ